MNIVYAPGCWDLLHVGHIRFLEAAAEYGYLIVGVPSDKVVLEDKGRSPIFTDRIRLEMVQSLRCVSAAILYRKLDFMRELEIVRPTCLAIGDTWGSASRHKSAENWVLDRGGQIVRIPRTPNVSTSSIIERIKQR